MNSGIITILSRGLQRWNSFWFTPKSTINITWIRILLGLTSLLWGLALLPDFDTFFFDDGLFAEPSYSNWRIGALQWFRQDEAAVVTMVVLIVSALSLTAGRFVKLAAPLIWYTMMSLQQDLIVMMNASDVLLRLWAFYFAVFAILTPSRYLSIGARGQRSEPLGERRWPLGPAWVLRIFQLQLCAIYVATAIAKAPGSRWHNGTAASIALGLEEFQRFYVPGFVRESVILGSLSTWFAFGLEITLPLLLWNRRTRLVAVVLGVALHFSFDYAMRLGYFFPGMLIGYVAFMRPGDVHSILNFIRRVFARLPFLRSHPKFLPKATFH